MEFSILLLRLLVPCLLIQVVLPQELPFEIPVQLVGFPIIIIAVRLSNFIKKLSYAVNPGTYRSRTRRGSEHTPIHIEDIEKKLIQEMGDKVCVYEDVCMEYADKASIDNNSVLDWQDIFSQYKKSPRGKEEFYLLSVFMGDIVKSRELCSQLAKRGRSCRTTNGKPIKNHKNQYTSENNVHLVYPQSLTATEEKLPEFVKYNNNTGHHHHHRQEHQENLRNDSHKKHHHQTPAPHHTANSEASRVHYTSSSRQNNAHGNRHNSANNREVHHHVEVHADVEHEITRRQLFGQNPHQNVRYSLSRTLQS